ncbi:MAG TPA: IS3 family transposase [Actinomycetota bacterium]|nr:IS3 family transposase [Actinomycetota bacterium]
MLTAVLVDYIDQHREKFGVEPICEVLTQAGTKIAPSTYHAAKARAPSARTISDATTTALIEQVHSQNYGVYGIRKVHAELNRQGHPVARCTVQRLMKAAGLRGISRAKGPRTTIPGTGPDTRPDLVERAFTARAPDELWVADITYCRTFAGWVYAAFVIDVYSRQIVGWQLAKNLRTDLALDALEMGLWSRRHAGRDTSGLIHHSDKGVQGGFNWSSQHLVVTEVFDGSSTAGSRSGYPSEVEVARPSEVSASYRGFILGRDRQGAAADRGRRGRRGVAAGRATVVPQRWRYAALRPQTAAVGPLLVLR